MKLKFLLSIALSVMGLSSSGQYENVWVFPEQKGIDFNSGSPVEIQTAMSGYGEASASVCDSTGQLLFYTEGDTLWNKNGAIMPNGSGLSGFPVVPGFPPLFPDYSATSSSLQGALIVPMPGNPDKYYVFSITSFESGNPGYMTYSIVDMSLQGGLGDVEPGSRAIVLDSNLTEAMVGIAGNDHNVWILVADQYPEGAGIASSFKSYELTRNGLNTTPVISSVSGIPPASVVGRTVCLMAVAPNREMIALTRLNERIELYDFNPETGMVSDLLLLNDIVGNAGICFSPNSSKLYYNTFSGGETEKGIYQLDLSSYTLTDILASKTHVVPLLQNRAYLTRLKLGPDAKIYFHCYGNYPDPWMVGVIESPDQPGAACAPRDSVLVMNNSSSFFATLPNHVPVLKFRSGLVEACPEDSIILQAFDTTGFAYEWSDGETGRTRPVSGSGTYWVRYSTMPYILNTDTFELSMPDLDPEIAVDGYVLSTVGSYETYQWMLDGSIIQGADQAEYTALQNGDYQVIVSSAGGCVDTSGVYPVNNVGIAAPAGTTARIRVYPNPATNFVRVQAPAGVHVRLSDLSGKVLGSFSESERFSLEGLPAGAYFLRIYHKQGGRFLKAEKLVVSP